MFRPVKMSEIELIVLSRNVGEISSRLYDLGIVELKTFNHDDLEKYENIDNSGIVQKLLEVRSTITILKAYFAKESSSTISKKDLISEIRNLNQEIETINKTLLHLEDEKKRKKVEMGLKVTQRELDENGFTTGYIPYSKKKSLKALRKRGVVVREYKLDDRLYFLAKAPKEKVNVAFIPFYLPKTLEKNIDERIDKERKKLDTATYKLEKIANSNLELLRGEERKLSKEVALLEARESFGKTKNVAVLSGFIQTTHIKKLKRTLEREIGEKFELNIKDAKEDAPTHLNHSTPVSIFESILQMYSLPKYREIDPTSLMMLIFPIFYGFILGDVIYGLISLVFFSLIKSKFSKIKDFITIFQISSISSIIFGLIYGEFMGFEFHGTWYGFFSRAHMPEELLIFAILFGFLHINIGVLIGFFNNLQKGFFYALTHNFSWFVVQLAFGFIALANFTSQSVYNYIGYTVLVISLIMMYIGHGVLGITDIPGFFANMLSYARLMAVGISSVTIALLVNEYTIILFTSGIWGIIGGITLFSVGHIFNIVLGNFESFLHTLRLHYVEFFTKFYSGGGREFKPFGKVEG